MIQRLFLFLLTWATFALPAQASVGIVVRLVAGGQEVTTPIQATLTNAKGREYTIALQDDGAAPDVIAGDGGYSGAMIIDGNDFTVFIHSGDDEPMNLGTVSWSNGTTARDLVITMSDEIVTLETGSGKDVAASGGGANAPSTGVAESIAAGGLATEAPSDPGLGAPISPATEAPSGPVVGAPISPATGAPTGIAPGRLTPKGDTPSSDATLYIIGGFLLLTLAIIAFVWFRPTGEYHHGSDSEQFELLPEPGLLGDGTPSVTDGLSTWLTQPEHAGAFFLLLLQSLAQHHRVLVVADEEFAVPIVHGGPLYRTKRTRPVHVADAVDDLVGDGGHPLAVLIQLPQIAANELQELVDLLPPRMGIVVLTTAVLGEHEPSVHIARVPDGWSLQCGDDVINLHETEWGIQVASPAPSV